MKIAITGTRGIPNRYGGFEQFAENLSIRLTQRGHDVRVYNPSFHPFPGKEFNHVRIIRKINPEKLIGPAANYLYDLLCLKDAISHKTDVILQCGYPTVTPFLRFLHLGKTHLVINPDGMEWQRPKWNLLVRLIIRKAEKTLARSGLTLVCDNPELVTYYKEKYAIDPVYIPYGADVFHNPDEQVLKTFSILPFEYYLVIARLEPENNLYGIIEGFRRACFSEQDFHRKLVIIGEPLNGFGSKLGKDFSDLSEIIFTRDIFDPVILDNLRFFSRAYFHGHSVGGTNPSLLEAMAAGSFIIAHDNRFNRSVLQDHALFFRNPDDITGILLSEKDWIGKKAVFTEENRKSIELNYQWEDVTSRYENLFMSLSS